MRSHIGRSLGMAAAALLLAASVQAQGKGHGNGKGEDKHEMKAERGEGNENRDHDRVIVRDDRRDDRRADRRADRRHDRNEGARVVYGNGTKVPPGLAKKPGHMPPGQYKKLYGTRQGASVLSDILRQRGYTVTRVVPVGTSQEVYYRAPDGTIQRAIVGPGTDRLAFTNVPAALLQEVLARLY